MRVVFTRFAMAARTHFHGVDWNWPFMLSMLERLNFDQFFEFRDMFLWWAVGSTAASAVIAGRHDDNTLRQLNRPGAWLLDSVFTMILVIRGDVFRQQQPAYIAISNPTLVRLARSLFGMAATTTSATSSSI